MKKWMVVVLEQIDDETNTFARFFDDLHKAHVYKQNAECGIGAYCELYERRDVPEEGKQYVLLEA